jgi:hypothetical protein
MPLESIDESGPGSHRLILIHIGAEKPTSRMRSDARSRL